MQNVNLKLTFIKSFEFRTAYLEFTDEKTAERNHKLLNGKKVGDSKITVDYVGEKSSYKPVVKKPELTATELDPLKLFVNGFARDITVEQLKAIFPTAQNIQLPTKRSDKLPIG